MVKSPSSRFLRWSLVMLLRYGRSVNVSAVIERFFGFVEMLIVAALVTVAAKIAWPRIGSIIGFILSFAAGIYLMYPLADKLSRVFVKQARVRVPRKEDVIVNRLFRLFLISIAGLWSIGLTSELQRVIVATIQLDEGKIRASFEAERRHRAYCASLQRKGEWTDECPPPTPAPF